MDQRQRFATGKEAELRFNRVLLVHPAHNVEWPGLTPPIGLGYLAETLRANGIEYDVVDMNLGYSEKHLRRKIEHSQPNLIGMSLITSEYKKFYELLRAVKQHARQSKIVVGGPHVTIFAEKVLQECDAVDYGVVREGESTLVELCRGEIPMDRIKGLIHRSNGTIVFNGHRDFARDLDAIPWPRYEKFELKKYFREVNIYSSRGCPQRCIFCARPCLSPKYRARSAGNVADELEYWYQKGYRQFNVEDDNFNLIKDRVYSVCDEIEKRRLDGMVLRASNGLRADRLDRDVLARMWEVGFRYIAIGADAGNDRMLKVIKKGETMEQIENALANACDLGYKIKLFFVFGNPTETQEDVEDMVRLSRKYPIQEVHFNHIIPYPGTELFDWIEKNGYFVRRPEEFLSDATFWGDDPVFETPELPRGERIRLSSYLAGVRKEVHRNTIRRIFGGHKIIGAVASRMFAIKLVEELYYKSRFLRKIMERFRYSTIVR